MNWTDHIHADPGLANYPQITDEALRAVSAHAAEALHDRTLLALRPGAAQQHR
jgi:hypothetical protein